MRNTSYLGSFDLARALKDWTRIISQPAVFLRDIKGSPGFGSALVMLLLYLVPVIIGGIITIIKVQGFEASDAAYGVGPTIGMIVKLLFAVPIVIGCIFFCAWILHVVGQLFSSKSPFSASFRALIFGTAPWPIFHIPYVLLAPTLLSGLLALIAIVWSSIILVKAVASEQEISVGASVAVVILTYIALTVIFVVFWVINLFFFAGPLLRS